MNGLNLIALSITLIFSTVSAKDSIGYQCNENMQFKASFFHKISIAEKYTIERTTSQKHTIKTQTFLNALDFISKYTHVSMDRTANYNIGYPSIEAFRDDKMKWIKWYDSNKCNNLK